MIYCFIKNKRQNFKKYTVILFKSENIQRYIYVYIYSITCVINIYCISIENKMDTY